MMRAAPSPAKSTIVRSKRASQGEGRSHAHSMRAVNFVNGVKERAQGAEEGREPENQRTQNPRTWSPADDQGFSTFDQGEFRVWFLMVR
jgi:hypothetical protein